MGKASQWETRDREGLIELFRADPVNHLYALADLEEPYWSVSRWWRRGAAAVGLVGLPDAASGAVEQVVYAVSTAAPTATLDLVAELGAELPSGLTTGPVGVADAMAASGRTLLWRRRYHRYELAGPDPAVEVPAGYELDHLGRDQLSELLAFYRTDPRAAYFLPSMLDDATFVGVRRQGRLVAVGGTHVVGHDLAAIGAVLVDPHERGHRLGAAVTAGVIARLRSRPGGADMMIGLNCADENLPARRTYVRIGFVPALSYEECESVA